MIEPSREKTPVTGRAVIGMDLARIMTTVALGAPSQSLGQNVQTETEETKIRRKRRSFTRLLAPLEVGFDPGVGFAPHPGVAGGGGAIR
jgi:hypothetical protein